MLSVRVKNKLAGFTFIELLVAMSVFTIIMLAISQIFVQAFVGYRNTKAVQRDVENAQYSLNTMAKELRTSSVVNPSSGVRRSSQSVKFFDYSQNICFQYRISSQKLQVARALAANTAACASASFGSGSFSTISTGVISGSFIVTPSSMSPAVPMRVGEVTVSLQISEGTGHTARIQTTVSLRDYKNIGLQ